MVSGIAAIFLVMLPATRVFHAENSSTGLLFMFAIAALAFFSVSGHVCRRLTTHLICVDP